MIETRDAPEGSQIKRRLGPIEGFSPKGVLLNYWEACIVKTVRTFVEHGVKPTNLIYLLLGAAYEAARGDRKAKDDAIMQMVLHCRITDPSSQQ